MNEIRLKAYGFSMEAVGSKKFIAQEREAFLDFTEEKVSKAAMKLSGNDARAEVHSQEVRNRENAEHGEDLVTMTHKTTQPISLEWIQEVVRLGRARDYFSEGDTIDIEFDGEVIQHDIIGIDAEKLVDKSLEHSITIQMHDLGMKCRPGQADADTLERLDNLQMELERTKTELKEAKSGPDYKMMYDQLIEKMLSRR